MYYFKWSPSQSIVMDINLDAGYEVLIEHDIPLLYITKEFKQYYLHYMIDKNGDIRRYLYLPISKMKLRALVTNGISLYESLMQENLYLYDLDIDDNVLFVKPIKHSDIINDALPKNDIFLPKMPDSIIDSLFGTENNKELVFILEGKQVQQHSIPFNDLSTYLSRTQQVISDSSSYYYEENNINIPINSELRVITTNAASFSIHANAIDKNLLTAIQEIIPKYTEKFIKSDIQVIHEILDILPTRLSQSLFNYYKFIFKNDYESIIKIKDKSLYLNKEYIKKIKLNINNAEYIRKESIAGEGYLLGANIKTNSFYFVDKEGLKTIKGHFSKAYLDTHPSTLTLSDEKLWKAKFQLSIEYNFSEFKKNYELLELEAVNKE